MNPNYEELKSLLATTLSELVKTQAELVKTQAKFKKALERIDELEKQINKNSKNSSKPPSTDQKKNTEDKLRKKRGYRAGKARELYPEERVDNKVICCSEACPHCNSADLLERDEAPHVLQQAELPQTSAIITQYERLKYQCKACQKRFIAALPNGIANSSFGPSVLALLATLTGRFHLAKREALQLIESLYKLKISEGSVINVEEVVSQALKDPYERIHRFVMQKVLPKHFDETVWRNNGKRQYAWIATTKSAAFYRIDPRRSRAAFERLIGKARSFPYVTDRYSAYKALDGPHQYCLAHLARNFLHFVDDKDRDATIATGIATIFKCICKTYSHYKKLEMSKHAYGQRIRRMKSKLEDLLLDGCANGKKKFSTLCETLCDEFEHLFVFQKIEEVEPTNNLAERDLRKLVIWRKKSYGTRSDKGKSFVAVITSISETLKKSKRNILEFLTKAISAFFAGTPAPFIEESLGF